MTQGDASIFSSMYDFYKKGADINMTDEWASAKKSPAGGGGGGGGLKGASGRGGTPLRGGRAGARDFHQGEHFFSSKPNAIVKVSYAKSNYDAARHVIQHADYLQQRERGPFEREREFFDRNKDHVERDEVIHTMLEHKGRDAAMFKIILSPNNNDLDRQQMTREVMDRFEKENDTRLYWAAIEHENTEHYHVHILVAGKDKDGHSLRLSPIQLEQFRTIAIEYQFELQYEYLNDKDLMAKELSYFRDHIHQLSEREIDKQIQQELQIYNPNWDQVVKDELLYIDPKFDKDVQAEFGFDKYYDITKEFADLNRDLELSEAQMMKDLQYSHPDLFPHLSRQDKEHQSDRELTTARDEHHYSGLQSRFSDVAQKEYEKDQEMEKAIDELAAWYATYPNDLDPDITDSVWPGKDAGDYYESDDLDYPEIAEPEKEQDPFEIFWESQNFDTEIEQDLSDLDAEQAEPVYEDTTQNEPSTDTQIEIDVNDPERDDDDW